MEELISVIINVYNGEKYIDKCLKSTINQTYKNLEILIVNDGSTDNTLQICEGYSDERIRIITTENMGLSKSRNVGIDNARGVYLYFIDADDFVEADVIEHLYGIAKEYDVPIATCRPLEIHDYKYSATNEQEKVDIISSKEMLKMVVLSTDWAGTIWNKLIKKDLFTNIRFQDRIINDVVVVYKLVMLVDSIGYSNQFKYCYFRHSDSITGMGKNERTMDLYKAAVERYDDIKEIYPDLVENELALYFLITDMYIRCDDIIRTFLKDEGAFNLYNKIFHFRNLFYKMKFSNKLKYLLFRINPKLCRKVFSIYSSCK